MHQTQNIITDGNCSKITEEVPVPNYGIQFWKCIFVFAESLEKTKNVNSYFIFSQQKKNKHELQVKMKG